MLALTVDSEDAVRADSLCLDAIKAAVAADIENAFAGQIQGQALPDHFPARCWMLDRLAHDALGFRKQTITEIDAMEPGLENLETVENFGARHGLTRFCAWRRRPARRPRLQSGSGRAGNPASKMEDPTASVCQRLIPASRSFAGHRSGLRQNRD